MYAQIHSFPVAQQKPACNAGDTKDSGSVPGLERSPGEGNDIHSSILAWEIPWTEEPGRTTVHGVTKHWMQLGD